MQEEWEPLAEYDGEIEVSSLGRVRRKNGRHRFLKPQIVRGGYLAVHIRITRLGINKLAKIHRLVATAFIPNHDNLPSINHKNEVKTDNRVENLEWCTPAYNTRYGTGIERRAFNSRNQPHRSCPILQYSMNGEFIQEFPSFKEVQRYFGKTYSNVWAACNGRVDSAYGYKWAYKYIEGNKTTMPNSYSWFEDTYGVKLSTILQDMCFDLACAVKYILRAGHKNAQGKTATDTMIEDLRKADWYIRDEIARIEKQANKKNPCQYGQDVDALTQWGSDNDSD